jgi:signal peptidase I
VPNTPISFPLVLNTLPILNCKSYIEWPRWGYKRVKGLGQIKRNDIVVFNFPAGDTIAQKVQNPDYYTLLHLYGREAITRNSAEFGDIIYRPVDKRENYVKRCIGMPGDSLQILHNRICINGQFLDDTKYVQYVYYVETIGTRIKDDIFRRLNVSRDDQQLVSERTSQTNFYYQLLPHFGFTKNAAATYNPIYRLPLTIEAAEEIARMPFVKKIVIESELIGGEVYPLGYETGWTRDNYGPIWIPRKDATIELTPQNLALYHRCIRNYENNDLDIRPDGSIRINGQPATHYTFRYDYYWMMGDNRHCSADSRSWGFVPEDHIVGKPIMVWLSVDRDRSLFDGGIRWKRLFRWVESFN